MPHSLHESLVNLLCNLSLGAFGITSYKLGFSFFVLINAYCCSQFICLTRRTRFLTDLIYLAMLSCVF